jgi:hypothetical protein
MGADGKDKFGFNLGTKRALAAQLYERGATQSEIIAATGITQYNMLKDAERRGHRVIRNGASREMTGAAGVKAFGSIKTRQASFDSVSSSTSPFHLMLLSRWRSRRAKICLSVLSTILPNSLLHIPGIA